MPQKVCGLCISLYKDFIPGDRLPGSMIRDVIPLQFRAHHCLLCQQWGTLCLNIWQPQPSPMLQPVQRLTQRGLSYLLSTLPPAHSQGFLPSEFCLYILIVAWVSSSIKTYLLILSFIYFASLSNLYEIKSTFFYNTDLLWGLKQRFFQIDSSSTYFV